MSSSISSLRRGLMQGTRGDVLRLAIPTVGEQILNMMVSMANTYMVGHMGSATLTAVGLGTQVVMLASSFFTAVATANTALVARSVGSGNRDRASDALGQSVLLGLLLGLVATILGAALASNAMVWLRAPVDVLPLGRDYLAINSLSYVLMSLMFIGNAALRGAGDTRTPLGIMAVVNIINVLVTYACMEGWGPLEPLGVKSPALGATIGRSVGGLIVLALLLRGRAGLKLRLSSVVRPNWPQLRSIVSIGMPTGIEQVIMRVGQAVFSSLVAGLGIAAYAAHQITITSLSASYMPGFAFGGAATTLVGQHLGAQDSERAKQASHEAWKMAAGFMAIAGLTMFVLAPQAVGLFIDEPAVIQMGTTCLRILGIVQPVLAGMFVFSGALKGAGDTRWPMLITGGNIWLVRLPLGRLLALALGLGLTGIWITMAVDLSVRAFLFWARFRTGRWQKIRI